MKTLGITGGIGAGKSTVAELLRQLDVATIDTDEVAREVVKPGSPGLDEIELAFGDVVLDADGNLQRDRVAQIVFANPQARARLEDILHPRIHAVWQAEVEQWRCAGRPFGAVIIPLLFEKNLVQHFSLTVCVACSEKTQRRRLSERGWQEDQIRHRLESQLSMRQKMELSHRVLWNDGPLPNLQRQLQLVLNVESSGCLGTG